MTAKIKKTMYVRVNDHGEYAIDQFNSYSKRLEDAKFYVSPPLVEHINFGDVVIAVEIESTITTKAGCYGEKPRKG